MTLVLDASLAAQLVVPQRYTVEARALVTEATLSGRQMVAPHLLPAEVTNAIRRHMRDDRLSLAEADALLVAFLAVPIELLAPADLHWEALRLANRYGLGVYDAHYVAVGQAVAGEVWTDDDRMLRAIAGRLPFVRSIRDYTPGAGAT